MGAPRSVRTTTVPVGGTPVHIYGPVPSRRLGFSLGVDILPFKTCSMDCVYCQLGSTGRTIGRRREYVPVPDVLRQIRAALRSGRRIDAITFSGSGEPTLHAGIGRLIAGIKKMTPVPVVVLTNASTLVSRQVRRDLAAADIVVPSLDAASESAFRRINRPRAGLTAARTIDGLAAFRRGFAGRIWLEVMLVKGLNDRPVHLRALRRAIARIQPDRVQLNTVVRPPAEKTAAPLTGDELEAVREVLEGEAPVEIIAAFTGEQRPREPRDAAAAILETLRRRPQTASDIARALGLPLEEVLARLRRLVQGGVLRERRHGGAAYYEPAPR